MSDIWWANLRMVVHLRRDHNYTWVKLKELYPGQGTHFWDAVRRELE